VRQSVSFERVDTVMRNPVITLVSDWYQNERVDGTISVNGGHSNYVEIKGSHFKVGETLTVTLTEIGGSATAVQLANQYGLIKWTDQNADGDAHRNWRVSDCGAIGESVWLD